MARISCTVVKAVVVDTEFDCSKIMDDEYIEQKRKEICENAAQVLHCNADEVVIHDSDLPALIE